ncbi:NmrA family transcriptional regulator [Mycobacterium kubicae]|uniref:NmrA family NAD(P)-binding protein n=1 Tax=Mycobacterium kubicae TaxID=120959 RepID=A0AAX1J384_9MYCO|nr:NmrA family NAD(P)-binding protein [Mycobacterium kubicae]MCV7093962.1 NmrA family NAD(P)-binding protein [Mycobacterium kubicae]ORV95383.1 NmrA family transcriptional regulator [Mycobacterium kubicae]QNI12422.1 NAD(P)H-binding protein [Mycobacterium kubicae]QPI35943.1 NmrA family NAD(P)-binding protein [Mycobacterium kubicae]GFG68230.1 NmrA family transcriptional regulator [Mycobacterium kubicae]
MTPADAHILVTGATGRHGATGAHVARRLLEEGCTVRVLARAHSDRTDALAMAGAEVVTGDLHDRRTLLPALADVGLAYFTYPVAAGVVSAAANYSAAVREAGHNIRTVVMSMAPAHPSHPSELGRAQWLAEEVMSWAGLETLVLRVAATFHENIPALHGDSIRKTGVLRNCFGDSPVGWISGSDAGELAVAALLHPDRFDGPVCYPAGSEAFNHIDIAQILTQELNRPITYQAISRDDWQQELLAVAQTDPHGVVNSAMAAHISNVGEAVAQRGAAPADPIALSRLIGRTPITLRDFVRRNRAAFETTDYAAVRSAGSLVT